MNILQNYRANQSENDGGHFLAPWFRVHLAQITESFWFCLTFVLFLIMGPFSAIAVLIGLGSLGNGENREQMTEPASL
jgi:hypothetical protein